MTTFLSSGCDLPEPCEVGCLDIPAVYHPHLQTDIDDANAIFGPADIRFVSVDEQNALVKIQFQMVGGAARGISKFGTCYPLIGIEPFHGDFLLAHELGHALGLDHRSIITNVMYRYRTRGPVLDDGQLQMARDWAEWCVQ